MSAQDGDPSDARNRETSPPKAWKFDLFKEFRDMLSNLDSVVDDFVMKRMGNGEVRLLHHCH